MVHHRQRDSAVGRLLVDPPRLRDGRRPGEPGAGLPAEDAPAAGTDAHARLLADGDWRGGDGVLLGGNGVPGLPAVGLFHSGLAAGAGAGGRACVAPGALLDAAGQHGVPGGRLGRHPRRAGGGAHQPGNASPGSALGGRAPGRLVPAGGVFGGVGRRAERPPGRSLVRPSRAAQTEPIPGTDDLAAAVPLGGRGTGGLRLEEPRPLPARGAGLRPRRVPPVRTHEPDPSEPRADRVRADSLGRDDAVYGCGEGHRLRRDEAVLGRPIAGGCVRDDPSGDQWRPGHSQVPRGVAEHPVDLGDPRRGRRALDRRCRSWAGGGGAME